MRHERRSQRGHNAVDRGHGRGRCHVGAGVGAATVVLALGLLLGPRAPRAQAQVLPPPPSVSPVEVPPPVGPAVDAVGAAVGPAVCANAFSALGAASLVTGLFGQALPTGQLLPWSRFLVSAGCQPFFKYMDQPTVCDAIDAPVDEGFNAIAAAVLAAINPLGALAPQLFGLPNPAELGTLVPSLLPVPDVGGLTVDVIASYEKLLGDLTGGPVPPALTPALRDPLGCHDRIPPAGEIGDPGGDPGDAGAAVSGDTGTVPDTTASLPLDIGDVGLSALPAPAGITAGGSVQPSVETQPVPPAFVPAAASSSKWDRAAKLLAVVAVAGIALLSYDSLRQSRLSRTRG